MPLTQGDFLQLCNSVIAFFSLLCFKERDMAERTAVSLLALLRVRWHWNNFALGGSVQTIQVDAA